METINGTLGDDNLLIGFNKTNVKLFGDAGNDVLDAGDGAGFNILDGGDGNDILYGKTSDQLIGGAGDDELNSDGAGGNTFSGGDGKDSIFTDRNDTADGGAGDDVIYAGAKGGNTITGGDGKDKFVITDTPTTPNAIADFNPSSDSIGINFGSVAKLSDLTFTQSGADAIISLASSGIQLSVVKNTLVSNLNSNTVSIANQAPTITSGSTASFPENGIGTVYTVTATDPNEDILTYSISGADANQFNISSTGAVTFKTSPNFEVPTDNGANNVYDINVIANDGSLTNTKAVVITVTNVNEAPTITSGATANFVENGTGTVYTVTGTDPDAGTVLTYSISGTDANQFNINSSTGAVTFKTSPNFESPTDNGANKVYDINVIASDSSLTTTKAVAITVTNVNEAPTITGATFRIDENSVFNTLIGQVVASDPDTGDKLTYAIASGNTDINGNGKTPFAIDIKTGEIKVNDPNDLDFETNSIFNLKVSVSDDLSAASEAAVTINLKNLADPVSTNYDFTNLPKLGTTSKGQDILLGGFSGLFFQGTNATNGNLKFTTLTDRGPNGEPTGQNRPFLLPNFQPEIVSFELNQTTGALSIIKRTGLFRADGTTKLTGLPNLQAGAGGTAYTDEIGVDLDGKVLTNDPFGIDSEGIVIADNGNYWVVDEYRPAIYEFDVNGKMLNRFIPKGTATAPNPDAAAGTFGTEVLPEVYAQRRANRGFEAVALEGNKLYAFIQSAIDNPDNAGDTTSRNSRNLRILEFDIVTKSVTGEYLYLLDSISASGLFRTDKLGDAVSLGNKKFAVVERDDVSNSDSNKLIYRIDLANATNINNLNVTFPTGKTAIEQLTESELTAAGIKVVTKNLIANAAKSGYTGVDKLEGLALVDSNTLALVNDNDFNVSGSSTPARLGLLSLPDALKFGKRIDSDVFSVGTGNSSLSFTVTSNGANQVGEVGVFIVDDADGNIDGLAPNASGYAEKALARAKVIFSAIDNNPNGFNANGLSRLLEFNDSDKFRFYVINDKTTTTSSVLANKSFDKVNFSTSTILNFRETSGVNKITFNNLDITIASSDDALAIGTALQDKSEGEVLDLTKGFDTTAFSKVSAEFTVNREAAFNNFVGFYKIENAKGDIKKSDGSIVSVGQSGYIQAAIAGQVSGIDLSVANQSSATSTGVFTAGSIFAPFIVVNGNPSAILDSNPNNDPAVYFPFLGANTDKVDHIRLLGNNTFGFEDLPSGGDFDYNDIIVKIKLTPVA
jgi:3-phytase